MKAPIFPVLAILLLAPVASFASVRVQTQCGASYGPSEQNLAVSDDGENGAPQLGYLIDGVFEPLQVSGCKSVRFSFNQILCDGFVLANVGKFQSTSDDGGTPRAPISIFPDDEVVITGSCGIHPRVPLTLEVKK